MALHHQTFEKPPVLSDLLLFEIDALYSRENVSIKDTDDLPLGTVLVDKSGTYEAFTGPGADADNPITPAAVLIVDIQSGTSMATAIVRGAVVREDALVWDDGVTDAQKTTALTHLKTLGIIARS